MTSETPDNQAQESASFQVFLAQPLTFGSVWRETLALFRCEGLGFMRVLLLPVGKILLGVYGSLVFCLGFTQWAQQAGLLGDSQSNRILLVLVVLAIACFFIFFLFQGFWEYLVYWASLCRNVQEAVEGRAIDFKSAYATIAQHKKGILTRWVCVVFVLLPLLPLLPIFGPPYVAGVLNAPVSIIAVLFLLGLLLGGILGLGWLVAMVLLTYSFQLLALEDGDDTVQALAKRSLLLTLKRPWLTLGLQVSLYIATSYLLPIPTVSLIRLVRLALPLDNLHSWLGGIIGGSWRDSIPAEALSGPASQLMAQLQGDGMSLAQSATDALLGVIISLLLLPLGTMAFTLVYLHLRARKQGFSPPAEA